MTRSIWVVSLYVLVLGSAHIATALTQSFCSFSSPPPNVTFNGSAFEALNAGIRLTDAVSGEAGSAFVTTPIALTASTSLHTHFRFQMGPSASGGDGIAFVLQDSAAGAAALGSGAAGMGYGTITPSVVIELDTFKNGASDPNANNVSLMLNGSSTTHTATATPAFTMAGGGVLNAWVDYNAASTTISVYLSQSATKPGSPILSHSLNLFTQLGAQAYIGFTSATGASPQINEHDVYELEFSTDGLPCSCEGDSACGGATPACGASGVCGVCSATNSTACTGSTPVCDVPVNTCVGCLANSNCANPTPICDQSSLTCRACASNADCTGSTPECATTGAHSGDCVQCVSNSDCAGATPTCDTTTNTCVCAPIPSCPNGYTCGTLPDGCGGTITCGTCTAPQTCGGGTPSNPNVCGCTPLTSCPAGSCGTVPDGCGGTISCETCPKKPTERCLTGTAPDVVNDPSQIRAVRALVEAGCVCTAFDGSKMKTHKAYAACAGKIIKAQVAAKALRSQCSLTVRSYYGHSTCGRNPTLHTEPCIQTSVKTGKITCAIKATTKKDGVTPSTACTDTARTTRVGCPVYALCIDAVDTDDNLIIAAPGDNAMCVPTPTATPTVTNTPTVTSMPTSTATPTVTATPVVPTATPCMGLCLQQMACGGGATTSISGTVYAPNGVDPLYDVLVYVPNGGAAPTYGVQPFTPGVACVQCATEVSGAPLVSTTTAVDGTFTLPNMPVGPNIPLVMQKGRWRRKVTIANVTACANTALTVTQTAMPSMQAQGDPADNIPLMGFVTGSVDGLECLLRKIGIADSQFSDPAAQGGGGRVRFYKGEGGPGAQFSASTPSATQLWSGTTPDINQYDMVYFACQGSEYAKTPAQQQVVINYANSGGRIFATHFSYVWLYNDPPFSATANWDVGQAQPSPDPQTGYVNQGFARGQAFTDWLQIVGASTAFAQIQLNTLRHDFDNVVAPSLLWASLGAPPTGAFTVPMQYTFDTPVGNPAASQCGRVYFNDFHVEDDASSPTAGVGFPSECPASAMTPQEKMLEFMIFDLSSCVQGS